MMENRSAGYLAYLAREHDRRARRAIRELERRAARGDSPAIFALTALRLNRCPVQMIKELPEWQSTL